jgi:2-keto-4-pentenoate hydratase/2-oxohepta-3-ene-1,7-dioic acid hydratase in catechol pathway
MTLNKFDLICTGSGLPKPKVRKNDNVKITINNLGELNSRI